MKRIHDQVPGAPVIAKPLYRQYLAKAVAIAGEPISTDPAERDPVCVHRAAGFLVQRTTAALTENALHLARTWIRLAEELERIQAVLAEDGDETEPKRRAQK